MGEEHVEGKAADKEQLTEHSNKRISERIVIPDEGLRFLDQGSGGPSFGSWTYDEKVRKRPLTVRLYLVKLLQLSDKLIKIDAG